MTLVVVRCERLFVAWVGNVEARIMERDGHLRTLTVPAVSPSIA